MIGSTDSTTKGAMPEFGLTYDHATPEPIPMSGAPRPNANLLLTEQRSHREIVTLTTHSAA